MKKIFFLLLILSSAYFSDAQTEPYRGGVADGHSLNTNATGLGNAAVFQPYFGGISDGYSLNSNSSALGNAAVFQPYFGGVADGHSGYPLISFNQYAYINNYSPFAGGIADGHARDSLISFNANNFINAFSPFAGGLADGHANDSAITFNQHGYITMYTPFAGGATDGWAGTLALGLIIVPIELMEFTGEQVDKKHFLHWKTSQEQNSAYFGVERSADAQYFKTLGSVAAAGYSATEKKYNYTDAQPMYGNNFYRLKIVDIDGTYKYSNVILLKMFGDQTTISIYPNPTTKTLNVNMGGPNDNSTVNATVFDAQGRYVQSVTLKKTNSSFSFDVDRLATGMYNLRIQWNGEVSTFRFIKN